MSNDREKSLWKELDTLAFLASTVAIVILTVAYFIIGGTKPSEENMWSLARTFALDIIANLIPAFLLFAGAYAFFRRIQALRSDQETEELASRVSDKILERLKEKETNVVADGMPPKSAPELEEDKELEHAISREFEITTKYFNDASDPQRIVVRFTNRGNNVIRVEKVKYSDTGLGLPALALLTSYRKEGGGHAILIPFASDKAEVLPGQNFIVELCLAQKWERDTINGWAGKWGYLKPDVVYNGQSVELFYSI